MNEQRAVPANVVNIKRAEQPDPSQESEPLAAPAQRSISCVIPCFNEAANLTRLLPMLEEVLWQTQLPWEVIVVDDGSTDATPRLIAQWSEIPGYRFVRLSRNFGKEAALTAGLKAARGDAVVLLDGDLQHSPQLIPTMLAHWAEGAEVVYAVRENRGDESVVKRLGASIFYRMLNASRRFMVPKDAGDFRLMDRKVVDALLSLPERSRFMKGLYAWVGFRALALPYTPGPRLQGASTFNALRLLHLAIEGLTAFTTWPLRLVSVFGLCLATAAFGYGGYLVADYLIDGNTVSGWTTIVVVLLLFVGIQMISTGILGEYVARIYEEVKGRPLYVIERELGEGLQPRKP
jgi:glycosyltransferase involved in cell wall biosynthesis